MILRIQNTYAWVLHNINMGTTFCTYIYVLTDFFVGLYSYFSTNNFSNSLSLKLNAAFLLSIYDLLNVVLGVPNFDLVILWSVEN